MKTNCILSVALLLMFACATLASAAEVSVLDYGAKGDGKADDRPAIQAAIDAVKAAGGGIVNFPEGVYIVTAPNKSEWQPQIKLCNNLRLQGEGMMKSVIRVADSQGPWDVIFSGESLVGFSMLDLAIDGNGATNPVISAQDGVKSPYLHMLVHLPNAKDVAVQRCRFTNLSGVWAIWAIDRAENVVIDSCLFDNIGGYTKNDWDHSCIRVDGIGPCVVSNNIMTSRFGAGTTGARTAVEIHGSNQKFFNNTITGFRYGVNVCSGGDGKKTEPSVHQYYIENKMVNVGSGFAIWGIDNRKYDNLVFERNDITIDVTGWKDFFPEFYGFALVGWNGGDHIPDLIENLRIVDNNVTFINSVGGTERSFGIRFGDKWGGNPKRTVKNCQILRNTFSRAYLSGIYLDCAMQNTLIAENTIIDPAQGDSEKEWKAAIKLVGDMRNLRIEKNAFYTDRQGRIAYGIYDGSNNLGGCAQSGNRVSGAGAARVPVYFAAPTRKGTAWGQPVK